jgi:dTDP-4-dehydrorhamnose 3,5-epimerase
MIVRETRLEGVYVIELAPRSDERGTFCEAYNGKALLDAGIDLVVDQVNVSRSDKRGTVRGMHWQETPYGQKKLVRCTRGAAIDVIVDVRPDSKTCGEWIAVELFPEGWKSVFIPQGFAHGWQALEDQSEIEYCTEGLWHKESERGISPLDSKVGIRWVTEVKNVAPRDLGWPAFGPAVMGR